MSQYKPATAKTVAQVLRAYADWIEKEDAQSRKYTAEEVNRMLDRQLSEDFFGTEGQLDPRGDHRD